MEMIVILVVVAGFVYVMYKAFTPKVVEVVLPEPTPEPVVEVAKPAAKKTVAKKVTPAKTTTARKPRTTTKK